MVYLSESSGYIPVTALRRPPPQSQQLPPANYQQQIDLEAWRPDPWDRDYNRRFRFNNTRVQRKLI